MQNSYEEQERRNNQLGLEKREQRSQRKETTKSSIVVWNTRMITEGNYVF
jgi:TnpA family transposase